MAFGKAPTESIFLLRLVNECSLQRKNSVAFGLAMILKQKKSFQLSETGKDYNIRTTESRFGLSFNNRLAGINCSIPKQFLNTQKLIIFTNTICP